VTSPTSDFGLLGSGGSFHVLFDPEGQELAIGARARALDGKKGELKRLEEGVDSRAVAIAGIAVCGNCRDQLDRLLTAEPITDIDTPTHRREENRMTRTNGKQKVKRDPITLAVWAISNKKASIRRAEAQGKQERIPALQKELVELEKKRDALRAAAKKSAPKTAAVAKKPAAKKSTKRQATPKPKSESARRARKPKDGAPGPKALAALLP
jgi:hypothetical protein